jgi:sec-independent protein translocase protein TatC
MMVKVADYDERLSLVEHLDELRHRIVWALSAVVVGIIVAAVFNHFVFRLLLAPLEQDSIPETARKITTFSPGEPFMTSLKVWVYVGLMLAAPVIIYEFWAFIGPAFAPEHKRMLLPVVVACTGLFLFGVVFGYLIVLPKGLQFLLGFNDQYFQVQNRASDYFSFSAWFLVAFGAVFEMPVVIVLLVRLGVTDTRFLRKNRKYAIVINAVVAMVATPSQDIFSMMAMWIPLLILYEASILVSRLVERKRDRGLAAEQTARDRDDDGEGPPGDLDHAPA